MEHLLERRVVTCPYLQAQEDLGRIAAESALRPERLALRVPLGRDRTLAEKNVLVSYGQEPDPMHFDHPWHVTWRPEGGAFFPSFDGRLTVRHDEQYKQCVLELEGSYRPPLGAAGAVFNRLIGRTIAAATARELLERFGSLMEERYRREERMKRSNG